jgi:hypothetical protein
LKRYATGDPGSGGYPNEYKEAVQIMARAGISEQELASTYVGGHDVATVSNKLIVTYDDIEREKAAVGQEASRRATYERALAFLGTQGNVPRGFARPGNSPENTEIMYEFFHKDGLTTAQVRTRTNQAWAAGYDAWKILKGY